MAIATKKAAKSSPKSHVVSGSDREWSIVLFDPSGKPTRLCATRLSRGEAKAWLDSSRRAPSPDGARGMMRDESAEAISNARSFNEQMIRLNDWSDYAIPACCFVVAPLALEKANGTTRTTKAAATSGKRKAKGGAR